MLFRRRAAMAPPARDALAHLLRAPTFELVPLKNALDQAAFLPAGATVSVTASPAKGIEATVALCQELQARGFRAVPHLSARMVRDRSHLRDLIAWLEGAGVDRAFVVGGDAIPPRTGHDRTAIVVYQSADEPGSLISILQEFAARRINLSHLSSRPTKQGGLGDYCFVIYADGHIEDELLADALRDLRAKQGAVKFLGSYPAAGSEAHTAREHADERWKEADDWVAALRKRIAL